MCHNAGKPSMIKQINKSIIRKTFMRREELTCAEISAETGISITTARAVMNEMLDKGELTSMGLADSEGGRKSEKFIINDNCYNGISVCVTEKSVYASVINIHAEIADTCVIAVDDRDNLVGIIKNIIESRVNKKTAVIGIGVPGIVLPLGFIRNSERKQLTESIDIIKPLKQRFSLPIILENDLKASALGFSKEIKSELTNATAAFINFESGCGNISAGFVEGDKIIHGMGNYSGELGLMPFDDKRNFCEALYNAANSNERAEITAKLIAWVCCAINPRHIMLCGNEGFSVGIEDITKFLSERLPINMIPKLFYGSDFEKYFIKGMAELTAGVIFDEK